MRAELPIRPRPRQYPPGLPCLDRRSDLLHLGDREGVRDGLLPVKSGDVVHRVAGQDLVTDRERECESEDDAGVLGAAIAASGELFEEVVAAGDPDLPQCEVFERREEEGTHVPLVEIPRGRERRSSTSMSSSQYETSSGNGLSALMPLNPGW